MRIVVSKLLCTSTRVILVIIHFSLTLQAQYTKYASEDKKALKYYEEARLFLKRSQFPEALEPLSKALMRDPDFIEVWLARGSAYNRMGNDSLTLYNFLQAIQIDSDYAKSKYAYFTIGEIYLKQNKYDLAKEYLLHYLRTKHGDPRREETAREKITICNFAIEAIKNPYDYQMEILPDHANDFMMEYFAALSVDMTRLYFTRRVGSKIMDDEDIYYSDKIEGKWSKPKSISPNINTEENEGAASVSADNRTIVFTSCNDRKGFGSCDIYISYKEGDIWSKPENIGRKINSPAWDAQPALSADGRTIYFVSNRAGGYGGKDIWAAQKDKKGNWLPARNLGKRINTNKDEIAPFLHANGETLYFSSEGHESMGGLDFFISELEDDSLWSFPRNLGYPLNDGHDQVSLTIASDSKTGIIAIEKEKEDRLESKLYSIQLPETFQVSHESAFLKGIVTNADTGEPIEAAIKVYKLNDKGFYSELRSDKVTGEYTIVLTEGHRYGVYATSPGYVFHDFIFELEKKDSFDDNILDIALQPIKVGAKTILGNIFFDHDSYELKKESMSELREVYRFLRKNPNVSVEISGHTDASGSASYNQTLSTKRAETVYELLTSKGIRSEQLTYKGYGAKLIISEDPLSGVNRRIEFKIIGLKQ